MSVLTAIADLKAAVKTRWETAGLEAHFPGGLWSGRLPADVTRRYPYSVMTVAKAEEPQYFAPVEVGDSFVAFLTLTLTTYNVGEAETSRATARAEAVLDWKPFAATDTMVLAVRPTGDARLEPDPTTARGENVWQAEIGWHFTVQRTVR